MLHPFALRITPSLIGGALLFACSTDTDVPAAPTAPTAPTATPPTWEASEVTRVELQFGGQARQEGAR